MVGEVRPIIVETGEGGGAAVQWQGRMLQVRTQDLRRALVYAALLASPAFEMQDPRDPIVAFAESSQRGQVVRVGWVRIDMSQTQARNHPSGGDSSRTCGWLRAKASSCLLYTSPSPRDRTRSRMPSSA